MAWEDPDLVADFLVEAEEHLDEADTALLALESRSNDPELCRRLYGCFHTLKGMASYVDLGEVEKLCHATEGMIGGLPAAGAVAARHNVDLALRAVTAMREHFQVVADCLEADAPAPVPTEIVALRARIAGIVSSRTG